MNKNSLIGVAIIVLAFWFFQSPIYYTLINKPYPSTAPLVVEKSEQTPEAVLAAATAAATEEVPEMPTAEIMPLVQDSITISPAKMITLKNDLLELTFSEDGAKLVSAEVVQYTYNTTHTKSKLPIQLIADSSIGILTTIIGTHDLATTRFTYNDSLSTSNDSLSTIQFDALIEGVRVSKIYELPKDSYYLKSRLESPLLSGRKTTLQLNSGITESESRDNSSIQHSERTLTIADEQNKTKRLTFKKPESKTESGIFKWISLNSKYFAFIVIPDTAVQAELAINTTAIPSTGTTAGVNYQFTISRTPIDTTDAYTIFLGPTKQSYLAEAKLNLQQILFKGHAWFFGAHLWFPPLCEGVLGLMNIFNMIFHDYGIAILLLTLLLKVITFPLTNSSMKSMQRMQELQPKIQKLQEKYKNNAQLLQQKMIELYQKEGFNPLSSLGGCLPLFLQMPIMIALFIVLRRAVELRGETAFFLPWIPDLSQAEVLFTLPFTIPFYGNNFAILPILMAGLMFIQNKMTMKDPKQQLMIIMMPVMMLVMFNNFPAGLTLYFSFSSLLQILQQLLLKKKPQAALVAKPTA